MDKRTTFSELVKIEICQSNFSNCCKKAILSSFLKNNLIIHITNSEIKWEIISQFSQVIRFISSIFDELYDVKKNIFYSEIKKINNRRLYKLEVIGNFNQMESDLEFGDDYPSNLLKSECCKKGYIIGAFLSGGSINSIEKSGYHFEIRSTNVHFLRIIQKILSEFYISSAILKRKSNFILYVKKSDNISDILKIMNTTKAMIEYEDVRIAKDFNAQICRLNNLDISNLKKSAIAGKVQVEQIKNLKKTGKIEQLPHNIKRYCEIRIEHPDASLNEIASAMKKKHGIIITKSGINHYNSKIKKLINQ